MSNKKKPEDERGLSKKDERELTAEEILAHPVVQQMNRKIEEMRQMVQGIPEAVGRGVAEAMRDLERKRIPKGAAGPPVPLRPFPSGGVEFHRNRKVIEHGEKKDGESKQEKP